MVVNIKTIPATQEVTDENGKAVVLPAELTEGLADGSYTIPALIPNEVASGTES